MNLNRLAASMLTDDTGYGSPAGVSIGVSTQDDVRYAVAGFRTPAPDPLPMTRDTAHDLASVTKIVATTTALIRLVSSRDVRLDDTVTGHLPEFTGAGKDAVTVADLLRHRGGLWEWQPLYLGGRTGDDAFRYAAALPLRYAPGSGRHYSDLGFMLLGRIIERATGSPLDTAIAELVTGPLGLAHTRYRSADGPDVAASAFGDRAEQAMVDTGRPYPVLEPSGFDGWRTETVISEVNDGNTFHAFGGVSGHAGLFGTLDDLLRFGTVFARYRDHSALWSPEVVAEFLAPGPDAGQALGFRTWPMRVAGRDTTMYGHPGFVGCVVGFVPGADLAMALCGNRLLHSRTPIPHDVLWTRARETVGAQSRPHVEQPRG